MYLGNFFVLCKFWRKLKIYNRELSHHEISSKISTFKAVFEVFGTASSTDQMVDNISQGTTLQVYKVLKQNDFPD